MGFCHSQEICPTNLEKKPDTKIELDDTKTELLQRK